MDSFQIKEDQLIQIIEDCLKLPDETDWVEFKENYFEYEMLGQRLCWLSNSACLEGKDFGFLIYWVQDATLNLTGTTFIPEREKVWNEPFLFKLSKDIQPWNIQITVKSIDYKRVKLVVFIVPAAISQTTNFKWKEYIRIGTATTDLSKYPDRAQKIWNNSYNKNFEKQIALSWLQEEEIFEYLDIEKYFTLLNIQKPDNKKEQLNILIWEKIIKKTLSRYEITNLWAILFARELSKFDTIKRKWVRVAVYNWIDKSADSKSYDGHKWYALGYEELLTSINLLTPSFEKVIEGRRVVTNKYPSIAIREFVANALIHQDLSIPWTSPLIEIYIDRIEILNPWIPLVEIDRFIDASPQSRNEDLASMMRRMKFCEELWGWVDKAIIAIEKEKLPAPKFELREWFTKITLYGSEKISHLSMEDRIRACFQHCIIQYISWDYMTNSSFRDRLWLPETQTSSVSRIIKQTVEKKFIKPFDPKNKANKHQKYIPRWI